MIKRFFCPYAFLLYIRYLAARWRRQAGYEIAESNFISIYIWEKSAHFGQDFWIRVFLLLQAESQLKASFVKKKIKDVYNKVAFFCMPGFYIVLRNDYFLKRISGSVQDGSFLLHFFAVRN